MGHTPTPWGFEVNPFGCAIAVDGVCIATTHGIAAISGTELPHEANASYIVSAVNSHASLVEEVERLRGVIDQATEDNRTVRVLVDALTEITEIPTVNGETEEWRRSQELRLHEQCRMIARRALEKSNA